MKTIPQDQGYMGAPKRGASLGRPSATPLNPESLKFTLQHVRLNSGGYDSGGAYWGIGPRLYWATNDKDIELFFRASDRAAAKTYVRKRYPAATFYR